MPGKLHTFILTGLLLLAGTALMAQQGPINDSSLVKPPANVTTNDTTTIKEKSAVRAAGEIKKDTSGFTKHSPRKATLLSTFVPGAGQVYNQKYWKVPVIYALEGAALYGIIFYTREYNNFREAYKFRLANGYNDDPYYNQFEEATLQSFRDYYRYYRDVSYIAFGAVYVLQIVDAAVDAHFFDFKITEDLSMNVSPILQIAGPVPSSQLLFTFKF